MFPLITDPSAVASYQCNLPAHRATGLKTLIVAVLMVKTLDLESAAM